jgi:Holliday junction resolvase
MNESQLAKNMALRIRKRGGWARKIAGGPGQAGLPDIIAGYRRYGLGLEVKMPGKENNVTVLQQKTLDDMAAAGMITAVVTTVGQVDRILDRIDKAYARRH